MAGGESANLQSWASEGVARGIVPPPEVWKFQQKRKFRKFQQKRVVFLVSSGKKHISPLLDPLEKFWKNP